MASEDGSSERRKRLAAEAAQRVAARRDDGSTARRRKAAEVRLRVPISLPTPPVLPALNGHRAPAAIPDRAELRFAQCWEDADRVLDGLAIRPGDTCVCIASAGETALAMLARNPAKVIAIDVAPAQLAALELRVAAYRTLSYEELLVFLGSQRGSGRDALYARCRPLLARTTRTYWDGRPEAIAVGLGACGTVERRIASLRRHLLPLLGRGEVVARLLAERDPAARARIFASDWDTWRWRAVALAMRLPAALGARPGLLPRLADAATVATAVGALRRLMVEQDPADNPYLQWVLTGSHGSALPFALRRDQHQAICANLDRLEWRLCAVEGLLGEVGDRAIDRFALSDIFEYMAESAFRTLLYRLARAGRHGGRLAYWNLHLARSRPNEMAELLVPHRDLAERLHRQERVGVYRALVIEEVI